MDQEKFPPRVHRCKVTTYSSWVTVYHSVMDETHERGKPSGETTLFTISRSATGPRTFALFPGTGRFCGPTMEAVTTNECAIIKPASMNILVMSVCCSGYQLPSSDETAALNTSTRATWYPSVGTQGTWMKLFFGFLNLYQCRNMMHEGCQSLSIRLPLASFARLYVASPACSPTDRTVVVENANIMDGRAQRLERKTMILWNEILPGRNIMRSEIFRVSRLRRKVTWTNWSTPGKLKEVSYDTVCFLIGILLRCHCSELLTSFWWRIYRKLTTWQEAKAHSSPSSTRHTNGRVVDITNGLSTASSKNETCERRKALLQWHTTPGRYSIVYPMGFVLHNSDSYLC